MPFTLFLLRIAAMLLIVVLVGPVLKLDGLASLAGTLAVWLALVAAPVGIVEALGFLNRAAEFVFGQRRRN